jgi:hypothetical protein
VGQGGSITFYATRRIDPPSAVIRNLLELLQVETVVGGSRTLVEDTEWEHFLRDEDVPTEYLTGEVSRENLPSLYKEGSSLSAILLRSPLSDRIYRAVEAAIPLAIRGNFRPTELYVTIGWHDLWENAEHDEGFVFARAFLSIHFYGYGTPSDWPAFRGAVFQIPEVLAVRRELEAVTGPLDQCVYWSV